MGMDDKAADIQTVFKMATDVLGEEKAKEWMTTSVPSIGGDTPTNHIMLDRPDAFENLKKILLGIKHGVYS